MPPPRAPSSSRIRSAAAKSRRFLAAARSASRSSTQALVASSAARSAGRTSSTRVLQRSHTARGARPGRSPPSMSRVASRTKAKRGGPDGGGGVEVCVEGGGGHRIGTRRKLGEGGGLGARAGGLAQAAIHLAEAAGPFPGRGERVVGEVELLAVV